MPKTILFATFSLWMKGKRTPINGMIEPLFSYFSSKKVNVDLIDGLHPGSSDVITIFEEGKRTSISWMSKVLSPILWLQNKNAFQPSFKFRDFFAVFEWFIRSGKTYDLFIGLESVYTLSGIIFRSLGRVKGVVYYVSDYSPNRYKNTLLNFLYLWLDRFCATHADFIWDVSKAFQPARIIAGINKNRMKPLIHVPNALFPNQICPLPATSRIPYSLVYAGTLNIWNGPDTAVEAMGFVRKKFPKASLHVYGTNGKDQARVEEVIKRLNLKGAISFHGFIGDVVKLSRFINHYMLGLAPYRILSGSHRAYGDATKLRLYMGAGLPILTTQVPPLGKEIYDFGGGIICKDDSKELAKQIIRIFSDTALYKKLVTKAREFARKNTWKNTYDIAFSKMFNDK
ncbi:MAG: hypothetical protein ACD_36C00076G0001 [uncultured bacterium]|uniref:Glycosyl transferase family 1 domain-containing protein n=1 Tax=Candidatus Gottesmanbacteria bacterium RIFCSPLOWO2_01_FULL_43_11b TaxID=1798392 RepID=A0A1F6AIJ6_9BACT|nr:MAG: hypothetical protein ACD_36C00076G0001 [uncultured bacterium]OGG24521.1 MAG: hypothetical protein A3A79_05040 [Candidatus Gottesmanbacteria bacterium RIFCSPLOWO2_01_FULL_43_11b]